MDKIKTAKIKNKDGSISEETYTISVDAKDVDMANGKELQETIGTIDIDTDGNIATQLNNLNNEFLKVSYIKDIVDNLNSEENNKSLSANMGNKLNKNKINKYNSVNDMKSDIDLKEGMVAETLGYYKPNDGGAATYNILKTESQIEYQEELDNNLYATLIVKNSTINIKQLGAYGDNIHDDTLSFTKFSNSNIRKLLITYGTYLINDILTFENKEIVGIGKPILKLSNQTTSREHYIILNGYARIENISFYNNIWATKTIGLKNCNDVIIRDCYSKLGDNLRSGGLLDLYTNNKNILIENCIFDYKSYSDGTYGEAGNGAGGIWIREQDSSKTSENIIMENCYISHYSRDEALGVWMWNGIVRNVQINNCTIEGKENNPSAHFITFSILDSSMNNCHIINKPGVQKGSVIHRGDISAQPVTINNCFIDVDETFGNGIVNNPYATIKDCTITNAKFTKIQDNLFKNCIINTPGFKMDNSHLEECTINVTNNYSFENSGAIEYGTQLINCIFNNLKIPVNNFIKNNAGTNKLYKIINCQFNGDYTGNTYFMLASNETELYIINSVLPKATCYLPNENNTGYIANNLIGTSLGSPLIGIKLNTPGLIISIIILKREWYKCQKL